MGLMPASTAAPYADARAHAASTGSARARYHVRAAANVSPAPYAPTIGVGVGARGKRIVARMQRLAYHDNRALAAGSDQHHVTRVRRRATDSVHLRSPAINEPRHLITSIIVSQRRKEMDLARSVHHLEEGDAPSAAGE